MNRRDLLRIGIASTAALVLPRTVLCKEEDTQLGPPVSKRLATERSGRVNGIPGDAPQTSVSMKHLGYSGAAWAAIR